jgi:hypothetical protein
MIRRLLAVLTALGLAVGLGIVNAPAAHADQVFNYAINTQYVTHGAGTVKVESWVSLYQSSSGPVLGSVGRVRLTDQGGVISASIDVVAQRFYPNNATIVRNDNSVWRSMDGVDQQLYMDTNDPFDGYWSNTRTASSGQGVWTNSTFSIRWGDGSVIQYLNARSDIVNYMICSGSFYGACGDVIRSIPI